VSECMHERMHAYARVSLIYVCVCLFGVACDGTNSGIRPAIPKRHLLHFPPTFQHKS